MEAKCHNCGNAELEVRPYKHSQKVGPFTVLDGRSRLPHCSSCGEVQITLDQLETFERDAVRVVLLEGKCNGEVMRFARRVAGLTQAQLATVLGYTERHVSDFETGKAEIPAVVVAALVTVLDAERGRLLHFADASHRAAEGELELRPTG
jgi:DNA-binding transcriptional regulator YiaG